MEKEEGGRREVGRGSGREEEQKREKLKERFFFRAENGKQDSPQCRVRRDMYKRQVCVCVCVYVCVCVCVCVLFLLYISAAAQVLPC